ncbi:unnamed protein product [Protopolystoma xenopodis]|uniref:FAD/NAD(P)-binding domain-containing protein n=1 Tax=Protopolystoma xenopodis TaxID=117903 RepID=A0A3S5A1P4_9PLAT|nr:unnamed protein product [Protopolystoma xenopodis]
MTERLKQTGGSIAIIGGGFLGCELACSLSNFAGLSDSAPSKNQLSVVHIFRESAPMGHVLPPCLSMATARHEAAQGIRVINSADVVTACQFACQPLDNLVHPEVSNPSNDTDASLWTGRDRLSDRLKKAIKELLATSTNKALIAPKSDEISSTSTESQNQTPDVRKIRLRIRRTPLGGTESIEAMEVDHVVCAIGVEPRVDLAESAGLELDPSHGGFLVNADMEARAGVYAAGDAASFWDPTLGMRRRVEHYNFAEESGALAGRNMAVAMLGRTNDSNPSTLVPPATNVDMAKYRHQSSVWSSLGPGIQWDAVGHLDSRRLITRAFLSAPLSTEEDATSQACPEPALPDSTDSSHSGNISSMLSSILDSSHSKKPDRGVIFYLTPGQRRLVGILLWNLAEDIYQEDEYSAPSRLNLARSMLAERRIIAGKPGALRAEAEIAELRQLAKHFDLFGEVESDYEEIKKLSEMHEHYMAEKRTESAKEVFTEDHGSENKTTVAENPEMKDTDIKT